MQKKILIRIFHVVLAVILTVHAILTNTEEYINSRSTSKNNAK